MDNSWLNVGFAAAAVDDAPEQTIRPERELAWFSSDNLDAWYNPSALRSISALGGFLGSADMLMFWNIGS